MTNARAKRIDQAGRDVTDRYGVTKRGEQYTGWAVLPSPNGDNWTEVEARRFIEGIVGNNVDWYEPYQSNAIRNAERKTHPDAGGNAAEFNKVQQARKLILG